MNRKTTVISSRSDHAAGLLDIHPGEDHAQNVCVELDLANGDLYITVDPEIGYAIPKRVHTGRVLRWMTWTFNALTADALLESLVPLTDRILASASITWNGQDYVGVLSENAEGIPEDIGHEIEVWAEEHPLYWIAPSETDEWMSGAEAKICKQLRDGTDVGVLLHEYQGTGQDENSPYIEMLYEYLRDMSDWSEEECGCVKTKPHGQF